MELKQVVKRSEKGSLLRAAASPQVYKKPVKAEQRGSRKVVLPIESELWSGVETIWVISIIAPEFARISITLTAPLVPQSCIYIYSLFLFPL